jgi:glycolate oxidase
MTLNEELARIAKGEVLSDDWSRQVYSMDASHYEVEPAIVACPKDANDVQAICQYAFSKKMHTTARGAGTGLLGQCLSKEGLVLDFSKHMNRIVDLGDEYVVIEPGIVKSLLDRELKKRNKFLPPDPASSNYCTVGGMIANNSSGIHCLGFGNTIDFIEAVDLVYADGISGHASKDHFDARMVQLKAVVDSNFELINSCYPKVSKNSCGYRLDAIIMSGSYEPHKVIAASEGTLALVTSARMRIIDIPQHHFLLILGFKDVVAAVKAVPAILRSSPVALEMLDASVLALEGKSGKQGCLLYVEYAGDNRARLEEQVTLCKQAMTMLINADANIIESATDEQSMSRMWASRKAALGNVMKMTVGSRKPVGLIEDTVVYPGRLVEHTTNLLEAYRANGLSYVMYGHVGDGNIHTRPLIDLHSSSEFEMMNHLANQIFDQVIASGGTITGEHGDGLARVHYIEKMYGKRMTMLFKTVKELFDPDCLLNPGKKVPFKNRHTA